MIGRADIVERVREWGLREDVIEKDYVLGWLLEGIASEPELASTWIFKGGTALRKCFYETYRFSEDLDFTVTGGGPEEPQDLMVVFQRLGQSLYDRAGIELLPDETSFVRRRNRRGNPTTQGRIAFRGPRMPPVLPKVRIDLTSDEVLVLQPVHRKVIHPYSDADDVAAQVACYPIEELLAEKLRALVERCRPRDLYDVIHIHRHPDLIGQFSEVQDVLARKCSHAGIDVPDADMIRSSPFRDELEQEWRNMLGHQLPHLPPFDEFWNSLDDVFSWLAGTPVPVLPRAESDEADPSWSAPRAMTSWRVGAPLELIRFAGANRLKVKLDYVPLRGRIGPRVVEPYSLRLARNGNLLLYVVNDYGALRSYIVGQIRGARVTNETFVPRYRVEF